jgi:uncharacterized damage-inducible protein DinB
MIKKYAAYNLWANKIIVEFLNTLDSELLNVEYVSSFTSIRKTLYHIYDAEKIWYQRIIKSEHIEWPPSKHFSISENPKVILEASQKIYDLVNDSEDFFFRDCTSYRDSKGIEYNTNNEEILHHVFNHSAFHRGQIITLVRQSGVNQLPSTDFITFIRSS